MDFEVIERKAGIRKTSQFLQPPLIESNDLDFLKNIIIHILPHNGGEYGPLNIEPITYELIKKQANIFIDHIDEVLNVEGNYRLHTINVRKIIKEFHENNRLFRILRRVESVLSNKGSTLIINHCLIPHIYYLKESIFSDYFSIVNIFKSLNYNIRKYEKYSDRLQFVPCELPEEIKSLQFYNSILKKSIKQAMREIDTSEYWTIAFINYLSESENKELDFIGDYKNVVYYWNVDNKLVFLRNNVLQELKSKGNYVAINTFLNFISDLVKIKNEGRDVKSTKVILELDMDSPIEDDIERLTSEMAEQGFITEKEMERFIRLSKSYKDIPNPMGEGTLENLIEPLTKEEVSIEGESLTDSSTIIDKSMTDSTIGEFDSKYIKEIYQKDIASMILNFQRAGVTITNYEITEIKDAATNAYEYKIQFVPISGSPSTVTFRLPKVNEDGTFLAKNVKCRMDKQRGDMPIRKIRPDRVALTSYFGKIFIDRDYRNVNNFSKWIVKKILSLAEGEDAIIKKLIVGDVFDHSIKVPRTYSAIANKITGFSYKQYVLSFDYKKRNDFVSKIPIGKIEGRDRIVCGRKDKYPVCIDKNGIFYFYNNGLNEIGNINELLDNNLGGDGPVEVATMDIMGKTISIGLILGYRYGLTNLLKKLKSKYTIKKKGVKPSVGLMDTFTIKLADTTLIIKRDYGISDLILSGFNFYKKDIIKYDYVELDNNDVYFNILDNNGMSIRYLKEIDLIFQMFIDPITLEILKEIKEPTSMDGLINRSVELLITDEHPRETDMAYMRIKGYERLAGLVYLELLRSLRGYINSPEGKQRKIELNPNAIWLNTLTDPSISQVNETNPVQSLREKEKVSYSGLGGRDAKTMVRRTREFHPNDRGVISESTTDNSKVGVIAYLSANPNLNSVRGITDRLDSEEDIASQVSTTFLLSPCSDRDEGKRVNFAGIQYAHTVAIDGNHIQPIRTGYETIIAHRSGSMYVGIAKNKGTIVDITENAISLEYHDGTLDKLKLGKLIAKTPGMNLIHELITDRGVGYKFDKGEVISFNKGFFKRDIFNPTEVAFLMGRVSTVALMESTDTLEDSCAISESVSKDMSMLRVQVRNISIRFDQYIHKMVDIGDLVEIDTPLCFIEDPVTAKADIFDEESLEALDILAANSPKAKYKGKVERIEIFYYGEIVDMSENLAKFAKKYDRLKKKLVEEQGLADVKNNKINESILVEQKPLESNNMLIRIYISNKEIMGVGDKGVFCNQLKTTVGRVMSGINETESGIPIDAIFGFQSIANRVVLSPQITGTTSGALKVIGKKASNIFYDSRDIEK